LRLKRKFGCLSLSAY